MNVLDFIHVILEESIGEHDLRAALSDGIILCRLMNAIVPDSIPSNLWSTGASRSENIMRFMTSYRELVRPSEMEELVLEDLDKCFNQTCQAILRLREWWTIRKKDGRQASSSPLKQRPHSAMLERGISLKKTFTRTILPLDDPIQSRDDSTKLVLDVPPLSRAGSARTDRTRTFRGDLATRDSIRRPRLSTSLGPTPPGSPLGMAAGSRCNSLSLMPHIPVSKDSITIEGGATYLLGNVIGRGQFGIVHRAIDISTGCIVAIKQIPLQNKIVDEVDKLMEEVKLLKSLRSTHIVKYEGFARSKDFLSIVIEYVENGSLLHTIRTFGCFSETLCALYTLKILDGLDYLHSKDVVHCDIKLANVLSTKTGDIKLTDFGVSINMSGKSTVQGGVNGTPNWLAPEVISLRGTSKASDIWALGCTILEMITGRPPYSGQNAMSAMYSIVEDEHPPLPDGISIALEDFLLSCFNKEPRARSSARNLRCHPWIISHHGTASKDCDIPDSVSRLQDLVTLGREVIVSAIPLQQIDVLNGKGESRNRPPSTHHVSTLLKIEPQSRKLSSVAPSVRAKRQELIAKHALTKSHFKNEVSCSICRQSVLKAMYCNECHIVAHPNCLLSATTVPCKRDKPDAQRYSVTPTSLEKPAKLEKTRRLSLQWLLSTPCVPSASRPIRLRRKTTKEECAVM